MARWATGKIYKELRDAVFARDGLACRWCGDDIERMPSGFKGRMPDNAATVDHVRPRAYGGTNALENLVAACFRCNQRRGCASSDGGRITAAELIELMRAPER